MFYGISPDGWFNKTDNTDLINGAGIAFIKELQDVLNSTVGNILRKDYMYDADQLPNSWDAFEKVNKHMRPVENGTPETLPAIRAKQEEIRKHVEKFLSERQGAKPTKPAAPIAPIFEENQDSGYRERTIKNASADATIHFVVDPTTAGEQLTKKSVKAQNKLYIDINANNSDTSDARIKRIVDKLNTLGVSNITLNIAGNGIYTLKGKSTQEQVDKFVADILSKVINHPDLKVNITMI
jgi:hypothetical protein